MKQTAKLSLVLVPVLLIFSVLLLSGCGSPIAEDQGCPKGTYLANSTDVITGTPDMQWLCESALGSLCPAGPVNFTPVTFTVTDVTGKPRNNICLLAFTGDTKASPGPFWYADAKYADGTVIFGTGPYNARAIVTDTTGVAMVFWSTAALPSGAPRTEVDPATTPPTYNAGIDQTGTSYIHVYSGTKTATFNVDWVIKGEPAK